MNKKIIGSLIAGLWMMPLAALAFTPGSIPASNQNISIEALVDIVFSILWPVAIAFFVVMFVLAAFYFFTAQGDPEGVTKARNCVIWGVVGVVVALLAWSIPAIIRTTLNAGGAGIGFNVASLGLWV